MKQKIFRAGIFAVFGFILFAFAPKVFAASLYFSPASGSFSVGSIFTVTLKTNTQGQAVNTAEARVSYTEDTLELVKVSAGSSFPLQTPGSPSKGGGQAYFSGGITNPGYTGSGGVVGVMTFRAKAPGSATLNVVSGQVLLNDGFGTNALSGNSSASFSIGGQTETENKPAPVQGTSGPGLVTVSSKSHPNSDAWYSNKTLELSWDRPNNAYGYSFVLDNQNSTDPDDVLDTTITTSKTYLNLNDGINYFHIKARQRTGGFGQVRHFKVQIDSMPPKSFEINLKDQSDKNNLNDSPEVVFESKDELSGIASYEVYLDGKLVKQDAVSPYKYEKLAVGAHNFKVVAYDKAQNSQSAELSVVVASSLPRESSIPASRLELLMYILVATNILSLLLSFVFWRKGKKSDVPAKDPVAEIQARVDRSLDELKEHLSMELLKFSRHSSMENYKERQQASKEFGSSIGKTKEKIDKEIGKLKNTKRQK